jgi:hypothetical protein
MPQVRAARAHLADRYAMGVETLLWEEHGRPLPDIQAVDRVITAAAQTDAPGQPPAAMDVGAALIVFVAVRRDIDRLEAELIETARRAGMGWATIADMLGLPDATTAQRRHNELRPLLNAPRPADIDVSWQKSMD